MAAERKALEKRKAGILARAIGEDLPGESREELDRMAEEDRRLAQEGLVPLMNGEGEIRHKHVDELKSADVTDRIRAENAILDWLVSRTENRLEQSGLWLPSTRDRTA